MSHIMMSEKIENEFTVDEMIGVIKWLKITDGLDEGSMYEEHLLEWQEMGMGEVTVASCKQEIVL